jgi:hypothetical protein
MARFHGDVAGVTRNKRFAVTATRAQNPGSVRRHDGRG